MIEFVEKKVVAARTQSFNYLCVVFFSLRFSYVKVFYSFVTNEKFDFNFSGVFFLVSFSNFHKRTCDTRSPAQSFNVHRFFLFSSIIVPFLISNKLWFFSVDSIFYFSVSNAKWSRSIGNVEMNATKFSSENVRILFHLWDQIKFTKKINVETEALPLICKKFKTKKNKKWTFSLFRLWFIFISSVNSNENYNNFCFVSFFLSQKVSENKTAEPASSIVVYFSGSAPRLQLRQHSNPKCVSVLSLLLVHIRVWRSAIIQHTAIMTFSFEQLFRSLVRTAVHKCYVRLTHSTFSETESKRCARERDATTDSIERESLNVRKEKSRLNGSAKRSHRYATFQWRTSECERDSAMNAFCVAYYSQCRETITYRRIMERERVSLIWIRFIPRYDEVNCDLHGDSE